MSAQRHSPDHPTMVQSSTRYLRTELMIGMLVLWCASSLVAVDMSVLVPTAFSPFITKLASPIVASVAAVLMVAPFATHVTGIASYKTYRFWQFDRGGSHFICAQTVGWSLYAGGLILVLLWIIDQVNAMQNSRGFGCPPGLLIGIAVFSLAGNASLLCSLHLFKEEGEQKEAPRTAKRAVLEALATTSSSFVLAALASMALLVVLFTFLSKPTEQTELLSLHSRLHSGSADGHPKITSSLESLSRRLSLAVKDWAWQQMSSNMGQNNASLTRAANNASHVVSGVAAAAALPSVDGRPWNQVAVSAVILAVVVFNCFLVYIKRRHSNAVKERRAKLLDGTNPGTDRHLDGTAGAVQPADYEAALPSST